MSLKFNKIDGQLRIVDESGNTYNPIDLGLSDYEITQIDNVASGNTSVHDVRPDVMENIDRAVTKASSSTPYVGYYYEGTPLRDLVDWEYYKNNHGADLANYGSVYDLEYMGYKGDTYVKYAFKRSVSGAWGYAGYAPEVVTAGYQYKGTNLTFAPPNTAPLPYFQSSNYLTIPFKLRNNVSLTTPNSVLYLKYEDGITYYKIWPNGDWKTYEVNNDGVFLALQAGGGGGSGAIFPINNQAVGGAGGGGGAFAIVYINMKKVAKAGCQVLAVVPGGGSGGSSLNGEYKTSTGGEGGPINLVLSNGQILLTLGGGKGAKTHSGRYISENYSEAGDGGEVFVEDYTYITVFSQIDGKSGGAGGGLISSSSSSDSNGNAGGSYDSSKTYEVQCFTTSSQPKILKKTDFSGGSYKRGYGWPEALPPYTSSRISYGGGGGASAGGVLYYENSTGTTESMGYGIGGCGGCGMGGAAAYSTYDGKTGDSGAIFLLI